ncbi:STI1 domain-containing protein [Haematococcus lacustris]|uniref:STI1 domain-containing protein n=1 Tax=Haematococcus lacustris TaxID=44745 RepID=A0A699ZMQ4_HAELA|nr:STI1 domain-containing protein [Haematococcus lacustris]
MHQCIRLHHGHAAFSAASSSMAFINTSATHQADLSPNLPAASFHAATKGQDKALRKGFFDSKGSKPKPKTVVSKADIITLTGKQAEPGRGGPAIPDFLRVEPDEMEKRMLEVKSKLASALQPTPDMIQAIQSNQELVRGFDDREVMAAVEDITRNPDNMKKYKGNRKVEAFYKAMADMAGQRLSSLSETQPAELGPGGQRHPR